MARGRGICPEVPIRAPALVALASLAFVSLGLPDAVLGIAWPFIRSSFGLPLDALGPLLVTFTTGYVVSSFSGGRLASLLGLGGLLAASGFSTALSLSAYSASPWWPILVAFGLLAGLGAGGIDTGVNAYAAIHHGPRLLNWLHACYGIGAVAGPAWMTAALAAGLSWRWGYAGIAIVQTALAAAFLITRRMWPRSAGRAAGGEGATVSSTLARPIVWLSVALFVAYTGVELATGIWAYSVLTQDRGIAHMMAGTWTALYWAGLTAGRLLGAAIATRLSPVQLLRISLLVLASGLTIFATSSESVLLLAGLVLAGVGAGPVFPTLIAATPARVGSAHASNAVGFQISGAALGQALVPWLIGSAGVRFGLGALAFALPVGALAVITLHEAIVQAGRGTLGDAATSKTPGRAPVRRVP